MITVASVPSSHVYVRHLEPVVDAPSAIESPVRRLPDPAPERVDVPGQWWPPRLLDASWLGEHLDSFDVLHVHFGFESFAPDELTDVVRVLRRSGTPLVLTVHDLHNPHFADSAEHLRQLDVLLPAADAVITLTPSAAAVIRARWGVIAAVIPHPHVVPLDRPRSVRRENGPYVIGVHAKNLRANLDPLTLMDALVDAARALPDATVRLDIDDDVFDSDSHAYSPTVGSKLLDYNTFADVDVRVHPRFDDALLWEYLSSIDVSVLPYRFGTHSGWMEACRDLGTAVVAPDCGFYADQGDCRTFEFGPNRFDADSLVRAVIDSHASRGTAEPIERTAQRNLIAASHEEIYARIVGDER